MSVLKETTTNKGHIIRDTTSKEKETTTTTTNKGRIQQQQIKDTSRILSISCDLSDISQLVLRIPLVGPLCLLGYFTASIKNLLCIPNGVFT